MVNETQAQNGVAINTTGTSADGSAILDLSNSVNKGFLLPQVSSTGLVSNPATGLVVYQTSPAGIYCNIGTPGTPNWIQLSPSSGNGNYILNQTTVQNPGNFNITGSGTIAGTFTSSGGAINLNSGTSTGGVTVGGSGTQNISLGSTGTTSTTNIFSGSNGVNINTNSANPINVGGIGAGPQTINIGTGYSSNTATIVNIGTNAEGYTTNILGGSGGLNINNNNASRATNINTNSSNGTVTIGGANIGSVTQTIAIGSSLISGSSAITIGSALNASAVNIKSGIGTGGIVSINPTTNSPTSINTGTNNTGTVSIGGTANTTNQTINVGGSGLQTINLGSGVTGTSVVTVGNTIDGVKTNIFSGSNGVNINTSGTGSVTIGNATGNVNIPKLSVSSVVLTDASKNLVSTTVLPVVNGGTGISTAPAYSVFGNHTNAVGAPTFAKVDAANEMTGILPIANGGTNGTSTPIAGAVVYGTGTAYAFTAAGTSGQVLTSTGAGVPVWGNSSVGTIGQSNTSAYSTGVLNFTTLANNQYFIIPGMTITLTVPANSSLLITTAGGTLTTGDAGLSWSNTQIGIYLDNSLIPNAEQNVISGYGDFYSSVPMIANWSFSAISTPSAASHTITVRAQHTTASENSSDAVVGGPTSGTYSQLQGVLTVTVIKN